MSQLSKKLAQKHLLLKHEEIQRQKSLSSDTNVEQVEQQLDDNNNNKDNNENENGLKDNNDNNITEDKNNEDKIKQMNKLQGSLSPEEHQEYEQFSRLQKARNHQVSKIKIRGHIVSPAEALSPISSVLLDKRKKIHFSFNTKSTNVNVENGNGEKVVGFQVKSSDDQKNN